MASGEPVTILSGPFMGFKGVVLRENGDKLLVSVNIFGRDTQVSLSPQELGFPGASLDVLEGEVLDTVARRGFRQREFHFWEEQSQRKPVASEPDIAQAFEVFSAQLRKEQEAAQSAALAEFRAEFGALEVEARNQKWIAERERWTGWREQARVVTDALEAGAFTGLEGPALDAEHARVRDAAFQLRTQIEAWQRTQALSKPNVPEVRDEALEAAIERDLDNDTPFLVYADWLLSKGNPRGELIALQAAGKERKTSEAALRRKLLPQLLGPLLGYEDRLAETWRLGFIETIRIEATRADEAGGVDLMKLLEPALRLPSTRFLRELTIALPSVHEAEVIPRMHAALAAGGVRPALRKLAFVTNGEEEMLSWTSAGELAGFATLFPNLETLAVEAGGYALTTPNFPRLKSLVLQTCGMTADNLAAISAADWPSLEQLELWAGSSAYGIEPTVDQFAPLLKSPRLPRLKSLGLCNCEVTDALCAAVLASPLLPQLESLSFAKGTMTDAGAQLLIAGADRLRHLERLDIDDNYVWSEVVGELQRALPQTLSQSQRTAEAYEGQLHRYASVGE